MALWSIFSLGGPKYENWSFSRPFFKVDANLVHIHSWIIYCCMIIHGLFNRNMIIQCVFVTGRRRRRRRRRKGTYIQPPEGRASSPSEGGFMKGGGSDGDYWVLILKIIESTDLVISKNKPRFVTAILAIYYGFMVYFFIGWS